MGCVGDSVSLKQGGAGIYRPSDMRRSTLQCKPSSGPQELRP